MPPKYYNIIIIRNRRRDQPSDPNYIYYSDAIPRATAIPLIRSNR